MEIALLIIGAYFLLLPCLCLAHELGHACIPLRSGRRVHVWLGSENTREWRVGNLSIGLGNPLCPWNGAVEVEDDEPLSPLAIVLGPLVSLALCVAQFTTAWFLRERIWQVAFVLEFGSIACLSQFLATVIPLRYPRWMAFYGGMESDGLRLLRAWRDAPSRRLT